ncbi:MAG: rhomboid family intramembrane serine protease [Chlorobi bacterium]|nr:rhomboid family intramembrane serine protease [Chlorobiota bacterium]
MKTPKIIKQLILVNIVFFLLSQLSPHFMNLFAMHFPENPDFRWWQIFTHMFMHGGIWHIAFNMYALWAFGSPIVYRYGTNRFLLFYFLSGLGALALFLGVEYYQFYHLLDQLRQAGVPEEVVRRVLHAPRDEAALMQLEQYIYNDAILLKVRELLGIYNLVIVGASGAIYGILVAFAFFYPNAKLMLIFLPYPLDAKYFVPLLILLDIFLGFTNYLHTPIAHFAHVGGALTGLFLLWLWRHRNNEYHFDV